MALLDGPDLCRDICVLASKNVDAKPRGRRNTIVLDLRNNLAHSSVVPLRPLAEMMTKLGHMPADRIVIHRSLTDEELPMAM